MKKYMPLEGLRWSRDSGSTLCDTPQNGRSRTGWGVGWAVCGMDADGLISKILQKNMEKCCVTRKVCLSLRRDHRGDGRAVRAA